MKGFTIAVLASLLVGCAGMETVPVSERSFEQVHEIQLSKKEIFDRSLEWMARTFVDSKAVIQIKDLENGKIIGKGRGSYMTQLLGIDVVISFGYTMIIDIKDNRYRVIFEGLTSGQLDSQATTRDEIQKTAEQLKIIDQSLYASLLKKNEKDW